MIAEVPDTVTRPVEVSVEALARALLAEHATNACLQHSPEQDAVVLLLWDRVDPHVRRAYRARARRVLALL